MIRKTAEKEVASTASPSAGSERNDGSVRTAGTQREALRPPVDIWEDADCITLQMDMPGVSKDRLTIQAERDSLVVEGNAQIDMPENMEPLYADVRSTQYRRSFVLSSDLDTDRIDARLRDGVLTLQIPKREEAKPRRIAVSAT